MKIFNWVLLLLVVFVSSSCNSNTTVKEINFPDRNIVYQAITFNNRGSTLDNPIGFVNADGSGNALIELEYRAHQPVFSKARDGIFFIETRDPVDIGPSIGYISFSNTKGEHKLCDKSNNEDAKFYSGFVFPLREKQYLLVSNSSHIQLYSMDDCRIVKTIVQYPDSPQNLFIGSAFPSNAGDQVIFDVYNNLSHSLTIKVIDVNTGKMKDILQNGQNPSFSPDDKKFAYLGSKGIYIADSSGSNQQLLVSFSVDGWSVFPTPFWSPDGTSLIYHKCIKKICTEDLDGFSIYKVDITSGKETKIIDKGLFPVWIQ